MLLYGSCIKPLLMNKSTYDGLSDKQRTALDAAAAKAQAFYLTEAKKKDAESATIFKKAGVKVTSMSSNDFEAWRRLAKETSYKTFAERTPGGQELLDLALSVE